MRHFSDLRDLSTDTLQSILDSGLRMKVAQKSGDGHELPLSGKTVAMIFENHQPAPAFRLGRILSLAERRWYSRQVICKVVVVKVLRIPARFYRAM